MEAATDLTQRLYLGEYAAALARYIDTIKPVGTIIYSQDSNDPKIANLELIVVREKYRVQLQTQAPQKMPDLQHFLAKNGFYYSRMEESEGGVLFLRYKKDIKDKKI